MGAGVSWNSPGQGSLPEGPEPDGSNGPTGTWGQTSSAESGWKKPWIAALWIRGLGGHQGGCEPPVDPSSKGHTQYAGVHYHRSQ